MKCPSRSRRSGFTQLELLVAITIIALLAALIIPAVQQARETGRLTQCRANLHGLGQAIHQYETVHGHFPSMVGYEESLPLAPAGTGLPDQWLSPHALMLPHLDQTIVFNHILSGEIGSMSGNPAENVYEGARVALPAFLCPSDGGDFGNNYRLCTGSTIHSSTGNGAFSNKEGRRSGEFLDGLSNTVAASEALKSDSDYTHYSREDYWATNAAALSPGPDTEEMIEICSSLSAPPPPDRFYPYVGFTWGVFGYDFTWYNHAVRPNADVPDCTTNGAQSPASANWKTSISGVHKASSRHSGGVNVVYMDGSIQFVSESVDLAVWRAIATRDEGETVGRPL